MYISQDPIRLRSGEPNFYAYVRNPNAWVDKLGLEKCDLDEDDMKKLDETKPEDGEMENPHRHHIVRENIPSNWKNQEAIDAVKNSQMILQNYGIDKNKDIANFCWAQNGDRNHSQKAAIAVNKKLQITVDANKENGITGDQAKLNVKNTLNELGDEFRGGTISR